MFWILLHLLMFWILLRTVEFNSTGSSFSKNFVVLIYYILICFSGDVLGIQFQEQGHYYFIFGHEQNLKQPNRFTTEKSLLYIV